jgi:hypothetical protein
MTVYSTRRHSSEVIGVDRMGAPPGHDFDTLFGIRLVSEHIDETAAAGPAAANMGMPPAQPMPTLMERQQLGEWLACGAPEH